MAWQRALKSYTSPFSPITGKDKMIKLKFTAEIIDQLHQERTQHPHQRVRQRMETVYLKALGLSHQEIGRIVRISQTTLREYLQLYQQGGVAALKELNFNQ